MTSSGYPLFTTIGGYPLNFRLLCNKSSMKTEFLLKITNHGGVIKKSHGSPRIILVGGSLPCEFGHYKCTAHPPFSKEPAFKIVWVDHCLDERELVDIKGYLLNSSPAFAKTDYMKRILDGVYTPPVPNTIPDTSADNYTKIDVRIPGNGDLSCNRESDSFVMGACQRALRTTSTTVGRSDEHNTSQGSRLVSSVSTAARNVEDDSSVISRTSQDPLNILRNSQRSSTPLSNLPVPPKMRTTFITGVATLSSSSDEEVINNPVVLTKSSVNKKVSSAQLDVPKLNSASCSSKGQIVLTQTTSFQRNVLEKENSAQLDVPSPLSPKLGTASCSSKGLRRPTQTTSFQQNELQKGGPSIPTTFSSSSSSDSDSPPRAKQSKPSRAKQPKPIANVEVRAEQDSSDSDQQFGPPPGAIVRLKGVRQNTKEPYTRNEEVAILKYIVASKKLTGIKSNVIWKAMDSKPGLEKRSWQSLKNHFLKFLLPNLERYSILTPEQIMILRQTEKCSSQTKNTQEPGYKL